MINIVKNYQYCQKFCGQVMVRSGSGHGHWSGRYLYLKSKSTVSDSVTRSPRLMSCSGQLKMLLDGSFTS